MKFKPIISSVAELEVGNYFGYDSDNNPVIIEIKQISNGTIALVNSTFFWDWGYDIVCYCEFPPMPF